MPKDYFLRYVDEYVSEFNISPCYNRSVELAFFDEVSNKWRIETKNVLDGNPEVYVSQFLVVATGENNEGYIPSLAGLDSFPGDIVHSSQYKSGSEYKSKDVLIVGCGNSGMEIAYDLSDHGASTSIVIRSPEAKSTLNGVGIQENGFPQHWKGEKWLYCAGFTRRGLFGVSMDAKAIAEDINQAIQNRKKK
ncbi:putative indole-3-pyruvate monooxygenase YUCCA10 [Morella rubra]|uniref:indole-3-pyruvate monooxygenase n=1 Tax=Morella rubra TaxID=262757 RepID=A0A6A1WPL5_9ROSI|nr:putative indole-3-pyruvate monooxygenase YUCCA10 [Morella rubra]